jgi:hypothetical protein
MQPVDQLETYDKNATKKLLTDSVEGCYSVAHRNHMPR